MNFTRVRWFLYVKNQNLRHLNISLTRQFISKYSMNLLLELGQAIAQLRRAQGLTQRELAARVGLGTSTLARFETGGVAEFGSQKLLRLLDALGHEMAFVPVNRSFTLDEALAQRQREHQVAAGVARSAQASAEPQGRATLSTGRVRRTVSR